ncbi:type II secretion system F family protein [Gulosibacter chungangensis]|uniref:Type II secretion system protein GspF domain-containing protein n=1 Tax=Gulosibacter chungangensis TaxID=979746 RepID=A0A7J5BFG3_9MICO|nr:hypothetical protein [Gulosibacter chungangensis]KAB1644828.1 hypothetical protein F8O05_00685 [Gulosibacter chungangensis]
MNGNDTYPAEEAAAVVERLAALLAGGGAPTNAWNQLAEFSKSQFQKPPRRWPWQRKRQAPAEPVEGQIAREIRAGADAAELLRVHPNAAWRALGATWRLAETTGAPLGPALRELAAGFRDIGQSEREVAIALASPQATSRIVLALPLVGFLLGSLLGFNPLGVLLGGPIGWVLLLIGGVLMLLGWWWNRRLVKTATARPATPGFGLDLVAMGMLGGNSAAKVRTAVSDTLRNWQLAPSGVERAEPVLELATRAGVPASDLLRSEATLERRRARTAAAKAAAQLEVKLMLPLGACILPAFLALGVAPIVIAVLGQVLL